MPNFTFVETLVYEFEAKDQKEALEDFREGIPKGFMGSLRCFDEENNLVHSELDAEDIPIHTYFEISTIHITRKDNKILECLNQEPFRVVQHQYGYWINLDFTEEDCVEAIEVYGLSKDLIVLLKHARNKGCNWAYFDRDVKPNNNFRQFIW